MIDLCKLIVSSASGCGSLNQILSVRTNLMMLRRKSRLLPSGVDRAADICACSQYLGRAEELASSLFGQLSLYFDREHWTNVLLHFKAN